MRSAILAVFVSALSVAAGCTPAVKADRAATAADLECTIEPVGVQAEGGLPQSLRLTVRNQSSSIVALTLPRPMAAEATPPTGEDAPFPLLAIVMKSAAGAEETPVYTDPRTKSWPKPRQVALAPGATWSDTYRLTDFYLWGPCGPDTGGSFTKYFWRGDKEVSLAASLMFGGDKRLESNAVKIRCNFEDWLFAKKR